MNIILVSECSKNALKETRRVLDQFAMRIGQRTWQTQITEAGLNTLRKLLKRKARKNTAVACHWIHGKNTTDLIWIVGNQGRFDTIGGVPTNTTSRDVLRASDESAWPVAFTIAYAASIAGLFHDFGKANALFQKKLRCKDAKHYEPVRHEWLSAWLFAEFTKDLSDEQWLRKLADVDNDRMDCIANLDQLGDPKKFLKTGPLSQKRPERTSFKDLVAWLIVSHHKLPTPASDEIWKACGSSKLPLEKIRHKSFKAAWNSPQVNDDWQQQSWDSVVELPHGTPFRSHTWKKKAREIARKTLRDLRIKEVVGLDNRFVSHLARLSLILADHLYSAQEPTAVWQDENYAAFANTDRKTHNLKQKLDEHNIGVAHNAYLLARKLPQTRALLPSITRLKSLRKPSTHRFFQWQNKAYNVSKSVSSSSLEGGFFGVNLASTGRGKTFGNARIMYGLAASQMSCRFNIALGLRTLTLQTGDALKQLVGLAEEDVAVLIGSRAAKTLHELRGKNQSRDPEQERKPGLESIGSESLEEPFGPTEYLSYEGMIDKTLFGDWLKNSEDRRPGIRQLISAPVLVSTIDYLMPACEGGSTMAQIAGIMRLLTSDLVLDEPDDFDVADLPALCRLVNWAGLFGSRVLLSSATLMPSQVEALYEAYAAGRDQYNKATGKAKAPVICAWFDEENATSSPCDTAEFFAEQHHVFIKSRIKHLREEALIRRRAELLDVSMLNTKHEGFPEIMAQKLQAGVVNLHKENRNYHQRSDSAGVSFGLIRFANITPMVQCAQALLRESMPEGYCLHLVVYHSQYPTLMRSAIESELDTVLNRKDPEAFWRNRSVQRAVQQSPECEHIFVVFGTPVTEVGRDHDYDWAIIEPSSVRSLIQLSGRIRRHRLECVPATNLLLMNMNMRGLKGQKVCFTKPGFEVDNPDFLLYSKKIEDVLSPEDYEQPTSIPRLTRKNMPANRDLVALEHARVEHALFGDGEDSDAVPAQRWWSCELTWSGVLQAQSRFRSSRPTAQFVLAPKSNEEPDLIFQQWGRLEGEWIPQDRQFRRCEPSAGITMGDRVFYWMDFDENTLLEELAVKLDSTPFDVALRFMAVDLPEYGSDRSNHWNYSPHLGIFKAHH